MKQIVRYTLFVALGQFLTFLIAVHAVLIAVPTVQASHYFSVRRNLSNVYVFENDVIRVFYDTSGMLILLI